MVENRYTLSLIGDLDHRDRINRVFGIGGGVAKGYKSNKAVYKIMEERTKKKNRTPLVKVPWDLKFFGDDSSQFWADLDKGIAEYSLVSQLDIKRGEPIHHNLSLSFSGIERFLRVFENIKREFENESILKDYILDALVWYMLPAPYSVNAALLYQSREKGIEPEKTTIVTFSLSERSVRDLVEIYREKVKIPGVDYEKIDANRYRINFSFSCSLFERYNYLYVKQNPSISELKDMKTELLESLRGNIIANYYFKNKIITKDDVSQRYDEIVEEITSNLPSMMESFNQLKNDVERMYDIASDLGSISLIIASKAEDVTSVKLHVSPETKQKLSEVKRSNSYMENFWHTLQPNELFPVLYKYGKSFLERIW